MCIACAGFGSVATVACAVRARPVGSWYADHDRLKLPVPRPVRSLPGVSGKWRYKGAPPVCDDRARPTDKPRWTADARQCLCQR
jgi:hypothetical protein